MSKEEKTAREKMITVIHPRTMERKQVWPGTLEFHPNFVPFDEWEKKTKNPPAFDGVNDSADVTGSAAKTKNTQPGKETK